MAKPRYIAPWQREGLDSADLQDMGPESLELLASLKGKPALYIDLNPVRAGIVDDPKKYHWSGYGAATAGVRAAREGLWMVMCEKAAVRMGPTQASGELSDWRKVASQYRVVLFEAGEERGRDGREETRRYPCATCRGALCSRPRRVRSRRSRKRSKKLTMAVPPCPDESCFAVDMEGPR